MNDHRMTAEYQRAVEALWHRECRLCVTTCVTTCANAYYLTGGHTGISTNLDNWEHEIVALTCPSPEWWAIHPKLGEEGPFANEADADNWIEGIAPNDEAGNPDEWETEEREREVFEYYAVFTWMAEKLRERGAIVVDDFLGLGPIWGRETTGQAASIDAIICDIYDALHSDTTP